MLYFAYGSNLNVAHMARRCPDAIAIGKFTMNNARLVFRGVADCIYEPGSTCVGGLWQITEECERALDRYEGVGSGMYRKERVPVSGFEDDTEVLYYAMNSTGIFPPSQDYLDTIRQGYRDFGLPMKQLHAAVKASWDDKAPSHVERQRYRRNGRPALGRPPVKKSKAAKPCLPRVGDLFGS
jgi:gamma-glutamylcyclotransferase (GGCT)/AIG2-like uncharacterized protein YtfP